MSSSLLPRVVGGGIGRLRRIALLDLQLQRLLLARRIVAAEPDIDELADRAPAGIPSKPPSRRIAASSVSCGDSPMRTCLPVGGCPVL